MGGGQCYDHAAYASCHTPSKLPCFPQGRVGRKTAELYVQLYVRRHYFCPPSRLGAYYEEVTSQVRAETQVMAAAECILRHMHCYPISLQPAVCSKVRCMYACNERKGRLLL